MHFYIFIHTFTLFPLKTTPQIEYASGTTKPESAWVEGEVVLLHAVQLRASPLAWQIDSMLTLLKIPSYLDRKSFFLTLCIANSVFVSVTQVFLALVINDLEMGNLNLHIEIILVARSIGKLYNLPIPHLKNFSSGCVEHSMELCK